MVLDNKIILFVEFSIGERTRQILCSVYKDCNKLLYSISLDNHSCYENTIRIKRIFEKFNCDIIAVNRGDGELIDSLRQHTRDTINKTVYSPMICFNDTFTTTADGSYDKSNEVLFVYKREGILNAFKELTEYYFHYYREFPPIHWAKEFIEET